MSDYPGLQSQDSIEAKRSILRLANGHCMCHSLHHDHKYNKCNRLLYSTYKFYNTFQDNLPINSRTWIAICSTCARYIKDVGY